MNSELLPFWELLLDGIQIFLCAMIFLFLIHNKIKYKRWVLTAAPPKETIAFSDEIHLQHLKQLTEKCFDTVIDTINQERLGLQTHFEKVREIPSLTISARSLPWLKKEFPSGR